MTQLVVEALVVMANARNQEVTRTTVVLQDDRSIALENALEEAKDDVVNKRCSERSRPSPTGRDAKHNL